MSVNRVITALMKWMAAAEPFQPQPDAAQDTVSRDGVHHVLRTGRPEAARRRQPGRNGCFIKSQQAENDHARHRSISLSNCRVNSANGASAAARRGFRTMSNAGSICFNRTRSCSRIRRRIRLRITAFPTARGIVKPMRGPSSRLVAEGRNRKATKYGHEKRLPLS